MRMAGDGPLRGELLDRYRELGLEDAVQFVGPLSRKAIVELLDRGRFFLYPTTKPEAFGISPLEAMARGVVQILGVPGGMNDYAIHGANAIMVGMPDVFSLTSAMQHAFDPGFSYADMSKSAISTAMNYGWESFRAKVNAFFDAVATHP